MPAGPVLDLAATGWAGGTALICISERLCSESGSEATPECPGADPSHGRLRPHFLQKMAPARKAAPQWQNRFRPHLRQNVSSLVKSVPHTQ
mmetsp:Transcript_24527/g.54594  ORF Transcript_24527/g.54594 Transcript_24527/m.54594 type:complete len:91 (+) Transcript_24527:1232-1504(+)